MRSILILALASALAVGCSKQKSVEEPVESSKPPGGSPAETIDDARARLLNQLKGTNEKGRFDAVDELSIWAETDPPTVEALIALLR